MNNWIIEETGAGPNFALSTRVATYADAMIEFTDWIIWREQRGWVTRHGLQSRTGHPAAELTNGADGRRDDGTYPENYPRTLRIAIVGPAAAMPAALAA